MVATYVASLVAVLPLVALESRPVEQSRVIGCYEVEIGTWSPSLKLGDDVIFTRPPATVELTSTPDPSLGKETPPYFVVRTANGAAPSIHHWNTWHTNSKGPLEVSWSTGFSGLRMEGTLTGDDWVGRAQTFWDFPQKAQHATIRLRRITCVPSPVKESPLSPAPPNNKLQQTRRGSNGASLLNLVLAGR